MACALRQRGGVRVRAPAGAQRMLAVDRDVYIVRRRALGDVQAPSRCSLATDASLSFVARSRPWLPRPISCQNALCVPSPTKNRSLGPSGTTESLTPGWHRLSRWHTPTTAFLGLRTAPCPRVRSFEPRSDALKRQSRFPMHVSGRSGPCSGWTPRVVELGASEPSYLAVEDATGDRGRTGVGRIHTKVVQALG